MSRKDIEAAARKFRLSFCLLNTSAKFHWRHVSRAANDAPLFIVSSVISSVLFIVLVNAIYRIVNAADRQKGRENNVGC